VWKSFWKSEHLKAKPILSDISGVVTAWEEGDHYIVEVTAKKQKPIELMLGERVPKIKDGDEVTIGDVVASLEDGSEPLTAPMIGKATSKKIKLSLRQLPRL
jgi:hypothetical protein